MDSSAANSVSNSPISSPAPQQHQEVKVSSPTVPEDLKKEVVEDPLDELEIRQIEKFKRYEVEARRHLMSKYFSDKTIFGGGYLRSFCVSWNCIYLRDTPIIYEYFGNIFDVKMSIDGEQVKVSRFPGYQSYADPANFNDDSSSDSISTVETPTPSANGKQPSQKDY